jgi:4-amino-4-deoxy-L-arabinose transferase-like glycosyltransferase
MQLVHPISIGIFLLGAVGLGLFALRRKPEDRLFLVWLLVIYVFFSLIASRTWRYVMPLYPVMAVAGASLVAALYGRAERGWKSANISVNRGRLFKALAVCLVAVTVSAVVYSAVDAERWISAESVYIPLPEATHYVAERINDTDELMVLCPINNLNVNVLKFYLAANEGRNNTIIQYPVLPPDSFNMDFNASEAAHLCRENSVKYVLLDENTGYRYFNSTLTAPDVADMLVSSGSFTLAEAFGSSPYRVFVFVFQAVPT